MTTDTAIQTTTSRPTDVATRRPARNAWTYRPSVDIFDTPSALVLVADLPGADPDRIDVSVESGVLTLQAEIAPRQVDAHCVNHEYGIGGFHRRFEVDDSIDTDNVTAEFRDGSLTVHLPKAARAQRRRIPVTS